MSRDMTPGDEEELDPGLARERTSLAWRRTNISLIALSTAVVKVSPVEGGVLLVLTALTWAAGRYQVRTRTRPSARSRRRAVRLTALLVMLVALAAFVAALER